MILSRFKPAPSSLTWMTMLAPSWNALSEMVPQGSLPRAFAGLRRLDAVIDGVADHVGERVFEVLDDADVDLDVFTHPSSSRACLAVIRARSRTVRMYWRNVGPQGHQRTFMMVPEFGESRSTWSWASSGSGLPPLPRSIAWRSRPCARWRSRPRGPASGRASDIDANRAGARRPRLRRLGAGPPGRRGTGGAGCGISRAGCKPRRGGQLSEQPRLVRLQPIGAADGLRHHLAHRVHRPE